MRWCRPSSAPARCSSASMRSSRRSAARPMCDAAGDRRRRSPQRRARAVQPQARRWCWPACRRSRCIAAAQRFGTRRLDRWPRRRSAWCVLLAGARASWITYALVLVFSGWRLLGWKKLAGVFAFGAIALVVLTLASPQVRERIERTTHALDRRRARRRQRPVRAHADLGRGAVHGARASVQRRRRARLPRGLPGLRSAARTSRRPGAKGPALHAHQIVLEVLERNRRASACCCGWPASRWPGAPGATPTPTARERARPAMLALAVTVFPFNTHLAFYSTFWGGLTLLLAALYAGSLLARE